jgi:hypothetical protein
MGAVTGEPMEMELGAQRIATLGDSLSGQKNSDRSVEPLMGANHR